MALKFRLLERWFSQKCGTRHLSRIIGRKSNRARISRVEQVNKKEELDKKQI